MDFDRFFKGHLRKNVPFRHLVTNLYFYLPDALELSHEQ